MYKLAVLGDKESICGFACLGAETVSVYDTASAKKEFKRLVNENYGVIYVTEFYGEVLREEISLLENAVTPAVILIPGVKGNTGKGMENIGKAVERAVGSLILD
ncbi:MAG: V-type ATP synthase subunit F [Ruminococcaceae bacterium]|nr:V-type ATP synthase subunit F [Oscillospiraceae bacterium]MBQ9913746.1 V-type ATP synthase subunit F [Clostridia bacterium]